MPLVGLKELCRKLDLQASNVGKLVEEGMPHYKRGQYDLEPCMLWYIGHLRKLLAEKKEAVDHVRENRARVLRLDGDRKELELQRAKGELINVEIAGEILDEALVQVRQALLAAITKEAPHQVGLKTIAKARARLEQMIVRALEHTTRLGAALRKAAQEAQDTAWEDESEDNDDGAKD